MKLVAFNGSPREKGNTAAVLERICGKLEQEGIETETFLVGNIPVSGCQACGWCKNHKGRCVVEKDPVNLWMEKMREADGILLASPIYFAGITGPMKAFLDRAFYAAWASGGLFRHKIGAAFTVARRAGCLQGLDQLNHYLLYSEMLIAPGNYWNVVYGHHKGDTARDEEGMQIIDRMTENLRYFLSMKAQSTLKPPEPAGKIFTNFIR